MCPFASNYPYSSVRSVFWAVRITTLNLPLVSIVPLWIRTILYYLHYSQHCNDSNFCNCFETNSIRKDYRLESKLASHRG